MRTAVLVVFLAGCSQAADLAGYQKKEIGALSRGEPLDTNLIRCDEGEPYYGAVTITTQFDTMTQWAEVSWQCKENGGARKYIRLESYRVTMDWDGGDK